jgi:hypothetical protein
MLVVCMFCQVHSAQTQCNIMLPGFGAVIKRCYGAEHYAASPGFGLWGMRFRPSQPFFLLARVTCQNQIQDQTQDQKRSGQRIQFAYYV